MDGDRVFQVFSGTEMVSQNAVKLQRITATNIL